MRVNKEKLNKLELITSKVREFLDILEEYQPIIDEAKELGLIEDHPSLETQDNSVNHWLCETQDRGVSYTGNEGQVEVANHCVRETHDYHVNRDQIEIPISTVIELYENSKVNPPVCETQLPHVNHQFTEPQRSDVNHSPRETPPSDVSHLSGESQDLSADQVFSPRTNAGAEIHVYENEHLLLEWWSVGRFQGKVEIFDLHGVYKKIEKGCNNKEINPYADRKFIKFSTVDKLLRNISGWNGTKTSIVLNYIEELYDVDIVKKVFDYGGMDRKEWCLVFEGGDRRKVEKDKPKWFDDRIDTELFRKWEKEDKTVFQGIIK